MREKLLRKLLSVSKIKLFAAYRNWMNSLGVSPYVNWMYSDLADGLIISPLQTKILRHLFCCLFMFLHRGLIRHWTGLTQDDKIFCKEKIK